MQQFGLLATKSSDEKEDFLLPAKVNGQAEELDKEEMKDESTRDDTINETMYITEDHSKEIENSLNNLENELIK